MAHRVMDVHMSSTAAGGLTSKAKPLRADWKKAGIKLAFVSTVVTMSMIISSSNGPHDPLQQHL